MSGVSNLRAMFEQNKGPAEDDRGRSPGAGSIGGASIGATSPRPLSKVRTSFVTVERNGQIGFQKDLSRESSTSKRRTSFSVDDETPKDLHESKQGMRPDVGGRKRSSLAEETTLNSPVDKPQSTEKTMEGTTVTAKLVESKSDDKVGGPHANGATKPSVTKPAEKPATAKTKTTSTPVLISTAKSSAPLKTSPKKVLKSPAPPVTPTTPSRSHVKEAPVKTQEKKTARASLVPGDGPKPTRKPTATAATESVPKTRIKESPPQTGFKKPRPKSPTRPVKLPASLTAHTASSGSKTNVSPPQQVRQTLSRSSGNAQATNSLQSRSAASRSPSRASATTNTSTLSRKPSTLQQGSSRPSLGPPPSQLKNQPSRGSLPYHPAPADDSFLARMMRPTTASASKTAEKPATTCPPKREPSVKRPMKRDGPAKPDISSKGSPAPMSGQATPAKVATKSSKPVEKALQTPISAGPVATKETPKKEAKLVKKAPDLQKMPEVPVVENTPVEGKTVEPTPTEPAPASEPAVEEVKNIQPEESAAPPEVTLEEAGPIPEDKKELTPGPETEEEPSIPETVKEEPVAEPKPAQIEETATFFETKEAAAGPQDSEAVEKKEEIPAAVQLEPAHEEVAPAAQEILVVEEAEKDTPAKIEYPLPTPSKFAFEEEDEEDAKARAEIEKLNAEFAKIASEGESN